MFCCAYTVPWRIFHTFGVFQNILDNYHAQEIWNSTTLDSLVSASDSDSIGSAWVVGGTKILVLPRSCTCFCIVLVYTLVSVLTLQMLCWLYIGETIVGCSLALFIKDASAWEIHGCCCYSKSWTSRCDVISYIDDDVIALVNMHVHIDICLKYFLHFF